jgi:hypothetical protein
VKISINHAEVKKGFPFTKDLIETTCDVQFSEEERRVMKKNSINPELVDVHADYQGTKGLPLYTVRPRDLFDEPLVGLFAAPGIAKNFEYDLITALKKLKETIEYNSDVSESTTLEL